jgi:hypothetical protein
VLLTVAIVLVLSMAVVASASAAPYLVSVSPTSASSSTYGSTQLTVFGQNFADYFGTPDVYLEQSVWPYDTIYASNVVVVEEFDGDYISCYINTYAETPGYYDVVVSGMTGLGQVWPTEISLSGAFQITGAPPVTNPTVASVRPETAMAGGPAFTLTVNGANFSTSPTVYWNNTALATSPGGLPNPTAVCTAAVPASLIVTPGVVLISVRNGSLTSNSVPFTVTAPMPTLTGLSPTSTWVNYRTPPTVTLSGTNFQTTAQVLVNGVVHAATFVSATQMTVPLSAADIAGAGTLNFSVRNSTSGTPTGAQVFTISAESTTPVTTISGADTEWHSNPVTLTITATDSQSGVWKTMFGIGTSMPWTQLTGSTLTVPGPMGGDPNGANVVSAYSIDNCNATENPPVQVTVNICTTGPQTEAFAPASVKKGKNCKISYIADSITPQCNVQVKIYNQSGSIKKTINQGLRTSGKKYSTSFTCNLAPGKYKVRIYATDAAGNAQSSMDADSFSVTK